MSYFFLTILFIAELVKEGIFFGKRKRIPVVQMGFITAEILFFLLLKLCFLICQKKPFSKPLSVYVHCVIADSTSKKICEILH